MKKYINKTFKIFIFLFISLLLFSVVDVSALEKDNLEFYFNAETGVDFDKNSDGTALAGDKVTKSPWATEYKDGKAVDKQTSAWNKIFKEYRGLIMGVSGIATLTMVILFIMNFMKLGASAGNPQAKHQATMGLLWTGIAAAGAGGVTIFVGVASNLLK